MNTNEFAAILHAIELVKAERSELSRHGPNFVIIHRFWQPETFCTPGEAIVEVRLRHRAREISAPLPTSLMLLFDYLARHQRAGQSASLIAAGLSVDPFTQEHGTYANAAKSMGKGLSRTALKMQIKRLRTAMGSAFRAAGLKLDPARVLVSEPTESNEVRYRLKIAVEWQHVEH